MDYIKCVGPKSSDDYDKYSGYKLDLYDAKVIEFPSYGSYGKGDYKTDYKPSECYKGYLLTGNQEFHIRSCLL